MNYALKRAISDWEDEVDREAVRLIERGMPPFDAAIRAREIVSQKRYDSTTSATTPKVRDDA